MTLAGFSRGKTGAKHVLGFDRGGSNVSSLSRFPVDKQRRPTAMLRCDRWDIGFFIVGVLAVVLCGTTGPGHALSPTRYTLMDRGRVVEVDSANIVRVRLNTQERVVTVRLLGVGSPRNRDRVRDLRPEVLSHIRSTELWEASRNYVKDLLRERGVEIWTRKWDRYDDKERLLAYILIPSATGPALEVNAEIIRNGMGFVTRDYLHVTFATYRQLEEEAKKNRKGIWEALPMGRISFASP